jgi:hypothetical protein
MRGEVETQEVDELPATHTRRSALQHCVAGYANRCQARV